MLKSLDVLIGLTVIMLALGMAVTVITQSITTILNSRGRHLKRGLVDLMRQLDPALSPRLSRPIAKRLLLHPLLSGSGRRLGSIVHREEFTKLLMEFATDGGAQPLEGAAKAAIKQALSDNGIADPGATLKRIRATALQLEQSNPELTNTMRQNAAILQEAGSDFVAKINGWFDQTMDRVSQRFTASTRAITFAAAAVVAVGLQVDTLLLVNRLAADDTLRAAFVREGQARGTQRRNGAEAHSVSPDSETIDQEYRVFLAEKGLIGLPSSGRAWTARWEHVNIGGVLISALLLSLGAPFWYNALGRLLQLRSVIAVKDDAQRLARQSVGADVRPQTMR